MVNTEAELLLAIVSIWLILCTAWAIDYWAHTTRTSTIIQACKEKGYYNFDQTRIICHLEEEKK